STLPSMSNSFLNLIEPLISTSLERMSLPECSAINLLYSIGDCFGDSLKAGRLFSSDTEASDGSPIDDIGFCGMNFFNTQDYWIDVARCQRILTGESQDFHRLFAT